MRKVIVRLTPLLIVLTCTIGCAPVKNYSTYNAHSHNDYLNANPFKNAFNEDFGSIEADVFAVDGILYVAHKKEEIQKQNTLKALYLDPLHSMLSKDSARKLNLLIDVKEDYQVVLPLLEQQLRPLAKYLSSPDRQKNITISISGNRPLPAQYSHYPDYIFFDDDFKLKHTPAEWQRVSLVSLPFDKISKWKGYGPIPRDELRTIKCTIDSVHTAGKPIRFWAAPDTIEAWKQQMKLGVDFIGTDKINELADYLRNGNRSTK